MILKKSKVKCTPSKPKKQKVSNFEISGQFGLYKISFTINPSKITKALLTKEITTTTFSSTTDPTVPLTPSCGLGYSRICTIDMDGGCPQDMTRHCFGSSTQSDTDPQGILYLKGLKTYFLNRSRVWLPTHHIAGRCNCRLPKPTELLFITMPMYSKFIEFTMSNKVNTDHWGWT